MNEKDLQFLGTTLGDISALLANHINNNDGSENDEVAAYELVNELYGKYIQYDQKK